MEDILASIRRILTEDGTLIQADPPADGTQPHNAAAALAAAEPKVASRSVPASTSTASVAEELVDARPAEEDVFMLSPDMRAVGHKLVSEQAAFDSTGVLSQLARAILDRRDIAVATRDVTLESMVREMLRPLLREWLDRNLPYLIERLVKKEIDLMISRAERLED